MQQLTNTCYGWGLPCWSHGWLGVACIAPALTHAHKEAGRCHRAALVDTGKLPIAPIANHRDMTTRSTAIPTGRCEYIFKQGGRTTWKTLPITELK